MNRIWNSQDLEQLLEPNDWMRLQEQVRSRAADLRPIATEIKSKLLPLDNVRGILFDIYGTLLISDAGEISSAPETMEVLQDGRGQTSQGSAQQHRTPDFRALQSLPGLLRAALPTDFVPGKAIQQSIREQHKRLQSAELAHPEVDIVELWHQVLLQQLDQSMHSSLSPFILARFALEYELLHNRVQLMPGALELLHWLAARNFYVGIISNAQFYTPIILSALLNIHDLSDINIQPDLCFWSYREGSAKPQAEFFDTALSALARHDLEPGELLYLGNDMRNDVWAATQAGFHSALFAGDRRSLRMRTEMPEAIEPDIVITDLGQLKGVL